MSDEKIEKNSPDFKKILLNILSVCLCVLAAIYLIFASFMFAVSLKTPPENTFELMGYKIYSAESDIEGTDIKSGALVVIKNTDDDEFYTVDTIKNSALVVPRLGAFIKNDMVLLSFCIAVVLGLVFAILFFMELHSILTRPQTEEIEFEFSENDVCETDNVLNKESTDL